MVTSHPEVGWNKINRAHGNTNIFIRFATAAFATSGQSSVRLKTDSDVSRGRRGANSLNDIISCLSYRKPEDEP